MKQLENVEMSEKPYKHRFALSEFVENVFRDAQQVLSLKSSDYTRIGPFENFEIAATLQSLVPCDGSREVACWNLLSKHLASIVQILNRKQQGETFDPAYLREKFGDSRNYLILLEAMLIDNILKQTEGTSNEQKH